VTKRPLDIPSGIVGDDTSHAASGRWADGSNMRFRMGRAQTIGGWETLVEQPLGGVCRTAFAWADNDAILNIAFGTHATLEVWRGGGLFGITPAGLAAGEIDGAGSVGYGTGGYGIGGFGDPSTADYFPRTWSLAAWGENLLANPRGGKIYQWTNDTSTPATALSNAPVNVTSMVVAAQDQVFALGCNEEVSGAFNHLCIRHSSVRNNNQWNTAADTTAREYILPGGGRIVAGRVIGSYLAVWTTQGLFLGQFVGSLSQPWRFDRVGDKCGLIGPNAVVVVGQAAFWVSPDRQFYSYSLGGAAQPLACPIREAFADNLAASQSDKIVASSISEFSEVRFDYPDAREGFENSRYVAFSLIGEGWYRGAMARTAMVDAGPSAYPCGVSPDGRIYWHERGQSADGAALSYFIETADQMLDEEHAMLVGGVRPDFQDQVGPVNVTLTSRFEPQGVETVAGPYAMAPGARKVDVRATGRFFKVRLSGNALPAACRVGRLVFDTAPVGAR